MAVKVMIADDHSMIREGLKQLLELEGDFEVIAEACDGVDCLEKLKSAGVKASASENLNPVLAIKRIIHSQLISFFNSKVSNKVCNSN